MTIEEIYIGREAYVFDGAKVYTTSVYSITADKDDSYGLPMICVKFVNFPCLKIEKRDVLADVFSPSFGKVVFNKSLVPALIQEQVDSINKAAQDEVSKLEELIKEEEGEDVKE